MPRILVIDDDVTIRTALSRTLAAAGYQVDVAADGQEGVKKQAAEPADLAVVDLFMPEKEGLETIEELRKLSPNIALIAISGGHATSASMLSVAQTLGADRILEKPFDSKLLLWMIARALGSQAKGS